MTDFKHRELKCVGKKVFRLGLAANYGIEEPAIRAAFERGMNYVYVTTRGKLAAPLREAIQRDRDRLVIAAGPTLGWFGGSVRRSAERMLKSLGTDHLDVFQLQWLGVTSALTDATLKELTHLKESGKVRALGCSIHDRARAAQLVQDSPLELFMLRYNAAHPGAEREIFPHLAKRNPSVVAYTATDWRKLLKRPSGWTGMVPTAGDCYRYCLSNPAVDLVLTGPASGAQLDENLAALDKGPLSDEEMTSMRALGKVIHG